MATPKPSEEIRSYLAAIGAKGGKTVTPKKLAHLRKISVAGRKTVTPKKRAHLQKISSQGGKTVTPKKLAHLRAAREKLAKLRAERIAK